MMSLWSFGKLLSLILRIVRAARHLQMTMMTPSFSHCTRNVSLSKAKTQLLSLLSQLQRLTRFRGKQQRKTDCLRKKDLVPTICQRSRSTRRNSGYCGIESYLINLPIMTESSFHSRNFQPLMRISFTMERQVKSSTFQEKGLLKSTSRTKFCIPTQIQASSPKTWMPLPKESFR